MKTVGAVLKTCVIFDIDGTLLNVAGLDRPAEGLEWSLADQQKFHDAAVDCEPHADMLKECLNYQEQGVDIVIFTARPEEFREHTMKLLDRLGVTPVKVYMRQKAGHACDIKAEALELLKNDGYFPTAAYEDDAKCVKMFRENGIVTVEGAGW
jgi:phosphoglycolate phosphatase-like HAD superfamily hydrolase